MITFIVREIEDVDVDRVNRTLGTDGEIKSVRDYGRANAHYLGDRLLTVIAQQDKIEHVVRIVLAAGCDLVGAS